MAKLAIYCPNLGAISETFVKKHMEDLLPDQTVVIAASDKPPNYGHWSVDCPKLILRNRSYVNEGFRKKLWNSLGVRSKNDPLYNKDLIGFLKNHNVKIILGEYLDYTASIIDLTKKLGIKLFVHGHGVDVSARLKSKFWTKEYLKFNECDGIITVSNYSKERLIKIGVKKELIHVIPCGIKLPAPFRKVSQNNTIKCIAVGRMVAKKGILLLLESFRLASEKNSRLTLDLIGNGVLYEKSLHYVKDHHLEDKVKLHGSLANEVVINMLRDADIFLQHSITDPVSGDQEGLPVAILEAMAHYLPVITTTHAGIPEAVINNKCGIIVNEGDKIGMAEGIITLAENKILRKEMGFDAREIVEKKFTWEIEKESLSKLMTGESLSPGSYLRSMEHAW